MVHDLIAQMDLGPEQRCAVTTRGRDVVVTAGAGAGKTRALVARYLLHLADGLPLRSIVAITFTRKAAREMRNRIREALDGQLAQGDLDADERERWEAYRSQLDSARIGTIHSLCAEIVRAHPAELAVDPRFQVLEEGQTELLRRQALDEALSWAAGEAQMAELFGLLSEGGLRALITQMLRARWEAGLALRATEGRDVLALWDEELHKRQREALAQMRNQPTWRETADTLRDVVVYEATDKMALQRTLALEALSAPDERLTPCLESLTRLDGINLQGGKQSAWGGKETLQRVKDALRGLRDAWRASKAILGLKLGPHDELLAAAMPRLADLYERAVMGYDALKDERNALDFDDLERLALALLKDDAICARWQDEVQALLVDECQDTNAHQLELAGRLRGQRGVLFVVGDAKQSIYRFRGADVAAFRGLREDLVRAGGAEHALATTYRAHVPLLVGLNALLAPILGTVEDRDRPWIEPFAPMKAFRQTPGPGWDPPYIELHLALGAKNDGALERAADALAVRLRQLVEGGSRRLGDGDNTRPVNYGDVAVLCRASRSFEAYEDAFERAGVPSLTVAGRGFYDRPEIRDLLNLLTALADPTDDLALVGALRSPALGLSDVALYRLRAAQTELASSAPSLWEAITAGALPAPAGEEGRYERAVGIIARLHELAGRAPVADLLKALLDATDYRPALVRAGQLRAARNVAKLLSDAHASEMVGVGGFVEYITDLRESGAREGEARATGEGAVQIMSVHAAKGLEFPIVVLGDLTAGGSSYSAPIFDPHLGVLLPVKDDREARSAAYTLGQSRSDDQERAEDRRLLYVAATRASQMLILNGCVGLKSDGAPSRANGWLGLLMEAHDLGLADTHANLAELGARTHTSLCASGNLQIACVLYGDEWASAEAPARVSTVPSSEALPPSLPLLEPLAHPQPRTEKETPHRAWRVAPRRGQAFAPGWVIGELVHQALARWRFPDQGFERWAERVARGLGLVDREQIWRAVERGAELLSRLQAHPLWAEIEASEPRYHELPYSLETDTGLDAGTIDLLYRREGAWRLVEFKTDPVASYDELLRLLAGADYVEQVARYCHAVERLLSERPVACLCLLDYQGSVACVAPWRP